ncbi:MAG TPA: hypothetical protein VGX27_00070 [Candidatus Dormibacteraeota bacterium]|nr:hypothetical protein [Candidatus Dormibacteraeota bacterium]
MRNFFRSPLTWMVAAEIIVVGALIAVAWNVVASANRPMATPAVGAAPAPTTDSDPGLPQIPELNLRPTKGPLPGLNLDPEFWRERLGSLNSDQVYLEQLEWRMVRNAELAVNQYLETVVIPAVRRAEHAEVGVVV